MIETYTVAKKEEGQGKKQLPAFNPTVAYWDGRAKGAQIYSLLAYCGVDYKHEMLVRGPAPDYHKDAWKEKKQEVALDFPNLPYLIDEAN